MSNDYFNREDLSPTCPGHDSGTRFGRFRLTIERNRK